jgi:hypothetical protein
MKPTKEQIKELKKYIAEAVREHEEGHTPRAPSLRLKGPAPNADNL